MLAQEKGINGLLMTGLATGFRWVRHKSFALLILMATGTVHVVEGMDTALPLLVNVLERCFIKAIGGRCYSQKQ